MFLSIKETPEYLSMPESTIEDLIKQKKIRAIHDGENWIINKEQFNNHLKQIEKYKHLIEEILNEPIPEDLDIKDED